MWFHFLVNKRVLYFVLLSFGIKKQLYLGDIFKYTPKNSLEGWQELKVKTLKSFTLMFCIILLSDNTVEHLTWQIIGIWTIKTFSGQDMYVCMYACMYKYLSGFTALPELICWWLLPTSGDSWWCSVWERKQNALITDLFSFWTRNLSYDIPFLVTLICRYGLVQLKSVMYEENAPFSFQNECCVLLKG